jgi:hypothetical protein
MKRTCCTTPQKTTVIFNNMEFHTTLKKQIIKYEILKIKKK